MRTLGEIAGSLGLEFRGDSSLSLSGLAPLESATAETLSFVAQPRYLAELPTCDAGALLLKPEWQEQWSGGCLLSEAPYLDYARATRLFDDRPTPVQGVHPSAQIAGDVHVPASVSVAANVVIGSGTRLAEGAAIGAGVVIGDNVQLGNHCTLHPGVVLYHNVVVGNDCVIHANTVIGSDGFGFAPDAGRWEKILQLGAVRIGDRCEIGASCTIDRGALHDTVIGDDVIIDNQVHIAHGVQIGDGTALAACVAIAGSTRIGRRCQAGGQAGFADHIEVADDVHVGGQARVSGSIADAGHYASGTPMQPFADWRRSAVRFTQLEQLTRRVKELEKQMARADASDAAATDEEAKS